MNSEQMACLNGLKGICALAIVLLHYVLAFYAQGFLGYGMQIPAGSEREFFMQGFPLSLFSNSSYPLYVFFAISGFVLPLRFFATADQRLLAEQAIKRYFRLMIPVFLCTIISYAVYVQWVDIPSFYALTGSPWLLALFYGEKSWFDAVISGVYRVFASEDGRYCSVLWCFGIIYKGSLLSLLLAFLSKCIRYRSVVYMIAFLALWHQPLYWPFIIGTACADYYVSSKQSQSGWKGMFLVCAAFVIAYYPCIWVPKNLNPTGFEALATGLGIWGVLQSRQLSKFLSEQVFLYLGKISLSLILVHCSILSTWSPWLFTRFFDGGNYNTAFWHMFLLSLAAIIVLSDMTQRLLDLLNRWVDVSIGRLWKRSISKKKADLVQQS